MKYELFFGSEVVNLPGKVLREKLNVCSQTELRLLCALALDPALLEDYNASADKTASDFGISRKELDEALAFWRGAGAIVPAGSASAPVKRSSKKPSLPHYTGEELAEIIDKNALGPMLDRCAGILGIMLNPTDINSIVTLYHALGVDQDYIVSLCEYCVRSGKRSLAYVIKTAYNLYDSGVTSSAILEDHIRRRDESTKLEAKLRHVFGIGERALTAKESKCFEIWCEWGYGEDIITRAYGITVEKTGKYTISYLDKILTNWHTTGYSTIEEIDEAQSRYSEAKKEEAKGSFDTDDFFERSLKRSMDNAVRLVKEKQSDKK